MISKKSAKQKNFSKVIVAMSGGVDSSVAAKLLKDQGYKVVGVFLNFWKENPSAEGGRVKAGDDFENKCCSVKALNDARRACRVIGLPLYVMNFSEVFKKKVVDGFLSEYKKGRTPNPCVICNKSVKLGLLIRKARELGFDYVATGHYARLKREFPISNFQFPKKFKNINFKNQIKLLKAKDVNKDQSYFLYALSQEQLAHLLFPVGDYTKTEVRALAKKFKLPTAGKKESQEVCFIPEKEHYDFLKRHLRLKKGNIKTLDKKIIGEHQGLPLYTIGQRKKIEIGGTGPYYAARLDAKTNTLYVASRQNDPALFSKSLFVRDINWLKGKQPKLPLKCQAVIRYHHQPAACRVAEEKSAVIKVVFTEPQRAVTPGQSIVFYNKNEVLGGGVIK